MNSCQRGKSYDGTTNLVINPFWAYTHCLVFGELHNLHTYNRSINQYFDTPVKEVASTLTPTHSIAMLLANTNTAEDVHDSVLAVQSFKKTSRQQYNTYSPLPRGGVEQQSQTTHFYHMSFSPRTRQDSIHQIQRHYPTINFHKCSQYGYQQMCRFRIT